MRSSWVYLLVIFGALLVLQSIRTGSSDRVPYSSFRELADHGQLAEVEIRGDTYVGKTTPDPSTGAGHTYRTGRIKDSERDLLARLDERAVPYTLVEDRTMLAPSLLWLVPIAVAIVVIALPVVNAASAANAKSVKNAQPKTRLPPKTAASKLKNCRQKVKP